MLFELVERVTIKLTQIIDLQSNPQHFKLNYATEGQYNMPSTFTNLPIRTSSDSQPRNKQPLLDVVQFIVLYMFTNRQMGGGGKSIQHFISCDANFISK